MTLKTLIAASLAISVTGGLALADSGTSRSDKGARGAAWMSFEAIDTDGDGVITRAEALAAARARFDARDTDGDGALDADEFAAAMAGMNGRAGPRAASRGAAMFDRMLAWRDSDGDGKLSFDEIGAPPVLRMMERADRDADGVVTRAEFDAMQSRMAERRQGWKMRGEGRDEMRARPGRD